MRSIPTKQLVIVPSIPHMGTNTVADAVQTINGYQVITQKHMLSGERPWPLANALANHSIYKIHMGVDRYHGDGLERGHRGNSLAIEIIIALVHEYPSVIPLRDPMMAAITRVERAPAHMDALSNNYDHMFDMLHLICMDFRHSAFIYPVNNAIYIPEGLASYLDHEERPRMMPFQNKTSDWSGMNHGLLPIDKTLRAKYMNGEDLSDQVMLPFDRLCRDDDIKELYSMYGFQLDWMR